jgi:hypothetical protein
MEPKVVAYLKRIIKTLSIGLLWMAINVRFGIMDNYAFIEDKISVSNVVYYIWFFCSSSLIGFYIYKIWKDPLNFEDDNEID